MRIAILSDVAAPTSRNYPGHGLGQAVSRLAEVLHFRKHKVVLFAAEGSESVAEVVTPIGATDYTGERVLSKAAREHHNQKPFDVFIDNTHTKILTKMYPALPIISVYHDIWMEPGGKYPVLVSEGMKGYPQMGWAMNAPVIHHVFYPTDFEANAIPATPPYALFCGIFRDYKNPVLAVEACVRAGIELVVMGHVPGGVSPFSQYGNTTFVGALSGVRKQEVFAFASVYLQLGSHESFGLTTVEAGLCGVPTVGFPRGGTVDLIKYGAGSRPLNGVFVQMSRNIVQSVADSIRAAMALDRSVVASTALQFCDVEDYAMKWEQAIMAVTNGH